MIIIWQGRQTPVDQYGILDWRISQEPSGQATIYGTIGGTIGAYSGSLNGTVRVSGSISGTIGPANGNLQGTVLVKGTISGTIGPYGGSLNGTVSSNTRTGTIAGTYDNWTGNLNLSSGNAGGIPHTKIKRKHSKRYEFQIGNVTLIAPSVAELEGKLAAYRAAHPGDKNLAEAQPLQSQDPVQQLPRPERGEGPLLPRLQQELSAAAAVEPYPQLPLTLPGGLLPGADRLIAERLAAEHELALAVQAALQAEEDDDMEALRMIIEMAA